MTLPTQLVYLRHVRDALPRVAPLPSAVWINSPTEADEPAVFTHNQSLNS